MTTISATTVLRSRNAARPDKVLSTLLLRYPRWIHAEQRTHRIISLEEGQDLDLGAELAALAKLSHSANSALAVDAIAVRLDQLAGTLTEQSTPSLMADPNLSRNAASSRAIPVSKMIADIRADPAIPLYWGANQKGMQASEECDNPVVLNHVLSGELQAVYDYYGEQDPLKVTRIEAWLEGMERAISLAEAFAEAGYHKQIVNRLLEPFMHITVLVSATEWDNFLELRDHKDAEPHIQLLAREVRKCLERTDDIKTLRPGEWHLPFITGDDYEHLARAIEAGFDTGKDGVVLHMIKKSVACCASTSYKTVDGFDMTLERAVELHDKLVAARPIHASPAEHVAQADKWHHDTGIVGGWGTPAQHRNFEGFRQYRAML